MSAHVCGYVGEWRSESGASGTDYAVHSSFISHFNAGRFGEAVDPRLDDKVKELEHELKQRDIRLQRLKMVRFLAFYFQHPFPPPSPRHAFGARACCLL